MYSLWREKCDAAQRDRVKLFTDGLSRCVGVLFVNTFKWPSHKLKAHTLTT